MGTNPTAVVEPLRDGQFDDWLPLWRGYQAFYGVDIPAEVTATTWRRFHDPAEPMHALGGFVDGRLVGIVHYLFHRSCWTTEDYCYLQDLFTGEAARGRGVGRALIEAVYRRAAEAGASRVYWLTQADNAVARALYDKLADDSGFVQYRKLF